VAFNGELSRDLAAHFLALAEKQQATTPLMIGHRNMGLSLWHAGKTAEARVHLDDAISLYDSSKHRALAVRFGQDVGASALATRTQVLWVLGYPEAALADADQAISDARKFGQAATFMYALCVTGLTRIFCRDYEAAIAQSDDGGREGRRTMEGVRNCEQRLCIGRDRQSRGRGQHYYTLLPFGARTS
jgi:tetratricopeptide (TPR) repeat protein